MNRILLYLSMPVASALLSALVVYLKPTPALQARRWLLMSMLCGAVSALLLGHYYHPTLRFSLTLDLLYAGVQLCLAPCFYLCILSLTSLHGIRKWDYLIFAPGAILMLMIVGIELAMGANESREALEELVLRTRPATNDHSWAYYAYAFFGNQFYRSFVILSFAAVFSWGAWAIYTYRKRLEDYLVDIPPSLTRGIRWLYMSFALFTVASTLLAACEYTQTLNKWLMPTFSVGIALSFAMMGYFAGQIRYSAEQLGDSPSSKYATHQENKEDPFMERLAIIEREALYRDPNLTIFSLSRIIGTNRTYLTRAFRECYGESFSEHINRLRIEEAIRLMTESPQKQLTEIASSVGYNSTTSLYRNFIRIHHCSPSEYMNRHKQK